MTVEQVKAELRELKHIERCIKVRETIRDVRQRRLKRLRSLPPTPEIEKEISEIEDILKSLKIDEYIRKANRLEKRYLCAISTLAPREQIIMLECFVNGEKTYWQVGEQLGYSDEWVRAKVREILQKLTNLIISS